MEAVGVTNSIFWMVLTFNVGYVIFTEVVMILLKKSPKLIDYRRRSEFIRILWCAAFLACFSLFLYFYNYYMVISPRDHKNKRYFSIFYTFEGAFLRQSSEKFPFYSLAMIAFYIHDLNLDLLELNYWRITSKLLYLSVLIVILIYKHKYYFIGLNFIVGLYGFINELLVLITIFKFKRLRIIQEICLSIQIVSWSYIFINILPFNYLMPTLVAKDANIILKTILWIWYGFKIWQSPMLHLFYHRIYHKNSLKDCLGNGRAAICVLFRETKEYRHNVTMCKAYHKVKLSLEKLKGSENWISDNNACSGNRTLTSRKVLQAIKYIMIMKRKLQRIREKHRLLILAEESRRI